MLHWRDDRDVAHREAILSLVNGCGIDVRATVSHPVTRRGQEAARVLGLRRLLDDLNLDRHGTTDHVIESRWPELDRRDRHNLNAARRDGLRRDLEMRHIDKGDDPMLWVADAAASIIAGFYAEAARGSHVWFHRLQPRTTAIHRV